MIPLFWILPTCVWQSDTHQSETLIFHHQRHRQSYPRAFQSWNSGCPPITLRTENTTREESSQPTSLQIVYIHKNNMHLKNITAAEWRSHSAPFSPDRGTDGQHIMSAYYKRGIFSIKMWYLWVLFRLLLFCGWDKNIKQKLTFVVWRTKTQTCEKLRYQQFTAGFVLVKWFKDK